MIITSFPLTACCAAHQRISPHCPSCQSSGVAPCLRGNANSTDSRSTWSCRVLGNSLFQSRMESGRFCFDYWAGVFGNSDSFLGIGHVCRRDAGNIQTWIFPRHVGENNQMLSFDQNGSIGTWDTGLHLKLIGLMYWSIGHNVTVIKLSLYFQGLKSNCCLQLGEKLNEKKNLYQPIAVVAPMTSTKAISMIFNCWCRASGSRELLTFSASLTLVSAPFLNVLFLIFGKLGRGKSVEYCGIFEGSNEISFKYNGLVIEHQRPNFRSQFVDICLMWMVCNVNMEHIISYIYFL